MRISKQKLRMLVAHRTPLATCNIGHVARNARGVALNACGGVYPE